VGTKKKGGPKPAFSNAPARPGGAVAQAVEDVHASIFGNTVIGSTLRSSNFDVSEILAIFQDKISIIN
jgi:hypothetical protein